MCVRVSCSDIFSPPPLPSRGSDIASRQALKFVGRVFRHGVRFRACCDRVLVRIVCARYLRLPPLLRVLSGPVWVRRVVGIVVVVFWVCVVWLRY
jgi:hypothetical protein